ncbi:hypothetical protein PUN28_002848 [Cardiocondyla obscurior]|uniref:Uncharacterized protein n=1 Tax=Cardiocondyla obscurior TaxID=286306 RepID=A0AAW2GWE4_9HYME
MGISFCLCFIPRLTEYESAFVRRFAAKQLERASQGAMWGTHPFATFSKIRRITGRHVSRDLDFHWHRNVKRFTLVNPGISGYHSGSRSRD